jgi:prevent-host-death family protein
MNVPISATRLRTSLPGVIERVRKGTRFTVTHRGRPAFQVVPVSDPRETSASLMDDPLYRAEAVGSSSDRRAATDRDSMLYRR